MLKMTLPDGNILEVESGIKGYEAAAKISEGLSRAALAMKLDGVLCEINTPIEKDSKLEFVTFNDDDGKKVYRHTAAHVLAQAVKRLYPNAALAFGPATDEGFFYDVDVSVSITPEVLEKLEAEMKKIIKENIPVVRSVVSKEEAKKIMTDRKEIYKVEHIDELQEGATITLYTQGEFVDLCAGPHLTSTGKLKAVKLTQCTGAYLHGDSKNKMLQRIYGTAFPKNSDLEEYLVMKEEAKKRDHNKLGRELEIFTTVDTIGQGLPVMLPKGTKIIQTLQRWVEDTEEELGWVRTKTPLMAKSDLYKISGHWDHYKEGMFVLGQEEDGKECFALRPMTCPFQYQAYLNRARSYRDLPMRLAETSTLFRNEDSGEMHGLIRVRQFTISEGHLMCTPEQLEDEFRGCLEVAIMMLKTLGLYEDVSYRFSQWDPENKEKYIGTEADWDEAQGMMKKILDNIGLDYKIGIGEAAFYGPKLDIQIKNVHGKEDTLITIQIDQFNAEKFGMEYVDKDGTKKRPYIIHRTSIGCYERTLALLIEKYAGAFPTWLAPTQVKILPISDNQLDYAKSVMAKLKAYGIRCELDDRNEKIGYKIREAQLDKTPYMLVIGDKEMEAGAVAVRSRKNGDMGAVALDKFIADINEEIATKAL
ncbi:MAG: threonine--tRNA ligase [Clostridia bacterium]|nr:threonine--tRNA ligase [Clostridia bacterium]